MINNILLKLLVPGNVIAYGLSAVAGVVLLVIGFIKLPKYLIIKNVPTSKIRSLSLGLCEIIGSAEPINEELILSPISKTPCVFYRYIVRKKKRSGRNAFSGRWVKIKDVYSNTFFSLKDETGNIIINPNKCKDFYLELTNTYKENRFDSLFSTNESNVNNKYEKINFNFNKMFGGSSCLLLPGSVIHEEYIVKSDQKVYILGTVVNSEKNNNQLMLHKGENSKFLIIGNGDENKIITEISKKMWLSLVFGLLCFIIGVYGLIGYFFL
jgi:hypothetical protein